MKGYSVGSSNGDKEVSKKDCNHNVASGGVVESFSLVPKKESKNELKKSNLISMDKRMALAAEEEWSLNKKSFLKRSHSTNTGTINVSNFPKSHQQKCKTQGLKLSDVSKDFPPKSIASFQSHNFNSAGSSVSSYCDDVSSVVEDVSPLLPDPINHNRETYENYAARTTDSLCESISRNSLPHVDMDSLSVRDDDYQEIPRISEMNDAEQGRNKLFLKPCSKSDNKELDNVILLTHSVSTLQHTKKQHPNTKNSFKNPFVKIRSINTKDERRTFTDESKSSIMYKSTDTEEKTYNELVDKKHLNFTKFQTYSTEISKYRHPNTRLHSSISDSENIFSSICDKSVFPENMVMSRSDGSEVRHIDDDFKYFAQKSPTHVNPIRTKSTSCEETVLQRLPKSRFNNIDSRSVITTSSRSLPTPTSLEGQASKMTLQRQISTPLPMPTRNISTDLTIIDSSDHGPPLPIKTGSRSNLSSPLYNMEEKSIRSNNKSTTKTDPPPHLIFSKTYSKSPPPLPNFHPNKLIHPHSHSQKFSIAEGSLQINEDLNSLDCVPPLPSRQIINNNNNNNNKIPPLPPKSIHTHEFAKCSTDIDRPHIEDRTYEDRILNSDPTTNFISSKESLGPEGCPNTCLWRQSFPAENEPKNLPSSSFQIMSKNTQTHQQSNSSSAESYNLNSEDLINEVNKPMPGRYETSDTLVYEDISNLAQAGSTDMLTNKINVLQKYFSGISITDLEYALQQNNLDTMQTIQYLKVKCLQDIGLGNEELCRRVLEHFDWNQNEAASYLTSPPQQQRQLHPFLPDLMEV